MGIIRYLSFMARKKRDKHLTISGAKGSILAALWASGSDGYAAMVACWESAARGFEALNEAIEAQNMMSDEENEAHAEAVQAGVRRRSSLGELGQTGEKSGLTLESSIKAAIYSSENDCVVIARDCNRKTTDTLAALGEMHAGYVPKPMDVKLKTFNDEKLSEICANEAVRGSFAALVPVDDVSLGLSKVGDVAAGQKTLKGILSLKNEQGSLKYKAQEIRKTESGKEVVLAYEADASGKVLSLSYVDAELVETFGDKYKKCMVLADASGSFVVGDVDLFAAAPRWTRGIGLTKSAEYGNYTDDQWKAIGPVLGFLAQHGPEVMNPYGAGFEISEDHPLVIYAPKRKPLVIKSDEELLEKANLYLKEGYPLVLSPRNGYSISDKGELVRDFAFPYAKIEADISAIKNDAQKAAAKEILEQTVYLRQVDMMRPVVEHQEDLGVEGVLSLDAFENGYDELVAAKDKLAADYKKSYGIDPTSYQALGVAGAVAENIKKFSSDNLPTASEAASSIVKVALDSTGVTPFLGLAASAALAARGWYNRSVAASVETVETAEVVAEGRIFERAEVVKAPEAVKVLEAVETAKVINVAGTFDTADVVGRVVVKNENHAKDPAANTASGNVARLRQQFENLAAGKVSSQVGRS